MLFQRTEQLRRKLSLVRQIPDSDPQRFPSPSGQAAMPFSSFQSFQSFLTRSRLVEPQQLQECVARVQAVGPSIDALIGELGQRHYLTPYQVGKLMKRETDGLRLGQYKLLYRNASGSFARVFRGCSVNDGRMIGIKVLRQRWAEDARSVNLFRREGELGKKLKHKNIVPIYEVGTDEGQHYIIMEFVEGGNFRELLKSRKKFSVLEASRYVLDMAEGLEYALSLGLTHRDLKLTNVLLSAQGVAKLVDFGLAGQDKSLASIEEEVDRAVEYATLERSTNAPDNDPRSDLYFLGAIYYELLTGVPPYAPSKNRDDRKQPSRYRNIRPIRQVDPTVPPAVMAIVDQLMQINPNERYQSPTDVIRDLTTIVGARGDKETPRHRVESNEEGIADSGAIPVYTGAGASTKDASSNGAAATTKTVLCVESRLKQQDSLRQYFGKHGYRVLMTTDCQRAAARIASQALNGVVVMSDSLGDDDEAVFTFNLISNACHKSNVPIVLVLSKSRHDLKSEFANTSISRILSDHQITLRDIRDALEGLQQA